MADHKARAAGIKKAAHSRMAQIAGGQRPGPSGLTPAEEAQSRAQRAAMPEQDKLQALEQAGIVPSALNAVQAGQPIPQVQGGVAAPPMNALDAAQVAAAKQQALMQQQQPAPVAPPPPAVAPAPAPAAPAPAPQTPIGPGVTVSPPTISSASDMPDPHAPPADDEDEDDAYSAMPWRMG